MGLGLGQLLSGTYQIWSWKRNTSGNSAIGYPCGAPTRQLASIMGGIVIAKEETAPAKRDFTPISPSWPI